MKRQLFIFVSCALIADFAICGAVVVRKPVAPASSSVINTVQKDSAVQAGILVSTQVGKVAIDPAATYDLTFRIGNGELQRRSLAGNAIAATIKQIEVQNHQNVTILEILKSK